MHRTLQAALHAHLILDCWTNELPWVFLGICTAQKLDLNCSAADFALPHSHQLPGELFQCAPVLHLPAYVQTSLHLTPQVSLLPGLDVCTQVSSGMISVTDPYFHPIVEHSWSFPGLTRPWRSLSAVALLSCPSTGSSLLYHVMILHVLLTFHDLLLALMGEGSCGVTLSFVSNSCVSTRLPHDDFTSDSILELFSLILPETCPCLARIAYIVFGNKVSFIPAGTYLLAL